MSGPPIRGPKSAKKGEDAWRGPANSNVLIGTAAYVVQWNVISKDSDATNRQDFSNQGFSVAPLHNNSNALCFSPRLLYAASSLLTSAHHKAIVTWRSAESLRSTSRCQGPLTKLCITLDSPQQLRIRHSISELPSNDSPVRLRQSSGVDSSPRNSRSEWCRSL